MKIMRYYNIFRIAIKTDNRVVKKTKKKKKNSYLATVALQTRWLRYL